MPEIELDTDMTAKNIPSAARRSAFLLLVASSVGLAAAGAQTEEPPSQPPQEASDAYEAYEAGLYEQALEEFVDRQVERPEDPELDLNIGSVHYQRKDYESAKTNYARAAREGDEQLRAEALYNLGNTAYREGKLTEAIDFYMESLDLNPDDEDAKFNLEFVREEIKRRQEQQQQREQNQDQQQDQQNQNQGGGEQDENEGGNQDQESQEQQQGDGGDQDQDGDGIPDDVERLGQNPTDPQNPDTDGDGKPDGEEDANQNGQLDPGESDPNTPDGEGQGQGQSQPQQSEGQMTPEQAARYLQALEERQPDKARRGKKAKIVRAEKDW